MLYDLNIIKAAKVFVKNTLLSDLRRALLCLAIHYEEPRTRPCRGEECCA